MMHIFSVDNVTAIINSKLVHIFTRTHSPSPKEHQPGLIISQHSAEREKRETVFLLLPLN